MRNIQWGQCLHFVRGGEVKWIPLNMSLYIWHMGNAVAQWCSTVKMGGYEQTLTGKGC